MTINVKYVQNQIDSFSKSIDNVRDCSAADFPGVAADSLEEARSALESILDLICEIAEQLEEQ